MLWLKALHLMAMVAWFSGLFYLPRLFVYHTEVDATLDYIHYQRFCTMERRLLWGITTPSAILTLLFGIWLLFYYGPAYFKQAGWLHAKLTLIFGLVIFHGLCIRYWQAFRKVRNQRSKRFYKIFNEVPVLFLVGIILLAVLKPF